MAPRPTTKGTAPPNVRIEDHMPNDTAGPPAMREAECPFCERRVLVYEDPPRCPLCACPLDEDRIEPYPWPGEERSPFGGDP